MPTENEITYPDILFKIANSLYCVKSKHVISISSMPKHNKVPGAAEGIIGIIKFRDEVVPVVDMRIIFGIPTLKQEYKNFVDMLEARKNDHINWVNELDRSNQAGEKFKLATDPHKCAFGKWYDKFTTDSQVVDFHMKKIADPHNKLHAAALEMNTCSLEELEQDKGDCSNGIMDEIRGNYMPKVLGLLEDAKSIFESSYHSMLIIIKDGETRLGLIVDEVLSIEDLEEVPTDAHTFSFNHSEYINTAKQIDGQGELILELDDLKLIARFKNVKIDESQIGEN